MRKENIENIEENLRQKEKKGFERENRTKVGSLNNFSLRQRLSELK
jgi:hypothetical protein